MFVEGPRCASDITDPAWAERDVLQRLPALLGLYALRVTGTSDPEPKAANVFLSAGGPYLRAAPLAAVPFMLGKDISDGAATCALSGASGLDAALSLLFNLSGSCALSASKPVCFVPGSGA